MIDASDTFDSLKLWVDANQNGVTDPGELHSLADYDITSISVASTPSTLTDSGNDITATGTFTRADGTTGMVGDVELDVDNYNTKWTGDSSVSADAALRPDLKRQAGSKIGRVEARRRAVGQQRARRPGTGLLRASVAGWNRCKSRTSSSISVRKTVTVENRDGNTADRRVFDVAVAALSAGEPAGEMMLRVRRLAVIEN